MMDKKNNTFHFLSRIDPILVSLGRLAEGYPENDPHAALIRLRQFGDLLGRIVGQKFGVFIEPEEDYFDLLNNLKSTGEIPDDILNGFNTLRMAGNNALHSFQGDSQDVKNNISIAIKLGHWLVSIDQEPKINNPIAEHFPPDFEIGSTENTPPLESPIDDNSNSHSHDLSGKNLSGMSFAGMDLTSYNFSEASLCKADFSNANLKSTVFEGADIRGADFKNSINLRIHQIEDSFFDEHTKFPEELHNLIK
jgi:hypothetical protein